MVWKSSCLPVVAALSPPLALLSRNVLRCWRDAAADACVAAPASREKDAEQGHLYLGGKKEWIG